MSPELEDDPFGTAMPEESARLRNGRYYFELPGEEGSGNEVAFTRVTAFIKAAEENFALERWGMQNGLIGLAEDEGLYMKLTSIPDFTSKEGKAELNEIAALAKERARGNDGARRGTAYHRYTEHIDTGHPAASRIPSKYRPKMERYQQRLREHRLVVIPEYVERRVMIPEYGLVGTLDRILMCELTGDLFVGDLKSARKFWSYNGISCQLAAYAHASWMWNADLGVWEPMPPVRQDLAVVMWMPHTHPSEDNDDVEIHDVRIDTAWERGLPAARAVREWQRESATLGSPRPLPR